MRRTILLCGGLSFIMAILGGIVGSNLTQPQPAAAQSAPPAGGGTEHLPGNWLTQVTATDGSIQFISINTFTSDGVWISSSFGTFADNAVTAGAGTWLRTGDHTYGMSFMRVSRDPSGALSPERIREKITLNATSDAYTGEAVDEILDASGNVVRSSPTTVLATRVNPAPLP